MRWLQALAVLLPLSLTPLLMFTLAEGLLNVGGGEKDILLALPWMVWSLLFAVTGWVLIYRHWPFRRLLLRALLVSLLVMVVVWLLLFATSLAGPHRN